MQIKCIIYDRDKIHSLKTIIQSINLNIFFIFYIKEMGKIEYICISFFVSSSFFIFSLLLLSFQRKRPGADSDESRWLLWRNWNPQFGRIQSVRIQLANFYIVITHCNCTNFYISTFRYIVNNVSRWGKGRRLIFLM